jgi:hypothetical protein
MRSWDIISSSLPAGPPSACPAKVDGEFANKLVGGFDCLCVISAFEIDA